MPSKTFQGSINHKTKRFALDIFYKSGIVNIERISVDKKEFSEMCRQGCSVYKKCWACPPYSPSFLNIKKKFRRMLVFISYIHTSQIKIKGPYLLISNVYNILAPKMHRAGMVLEKRLSGLLLKSGPCRICRKCSAQEHKPCKFPDKRRYALESAGIDVQKLSLLLNHKLLWYSKKSLPEYISVVCGVLTNKNIQQEDAYKYFLNSFVSQAKQGAVYNNRQTNNKSK